jgi:Flp pilus assembly protein TadG
MEILLAPTQPVRRESTARGMANLSSQSGQSLVELAMALPVLVLLALGVIEVGRYAYIGILVANAARAGAAYGGQSLPQAVNANGVTAAVQNDFQDNRQDAKNLSLSSITSSASCGCDSNGTVTTADCSGATNPTAGTCAAGHWVVMVSVTATGTFTSLFNYPGIPKSITISRTSTMRVAQI